MKKTLLILILGLLVGCGGKTTCPDCPGQEIEKEPTMEERKEPTMEERVEALESQISLLNELLGYEEVWLETKYQCEKLKSNEYCFLKLYKIS